MADREKERGKRISEKKINLKPTTKEEKSAKRARRLNYWSPGKLIERKKNGLLEDIGEKSGAQQEKIADRLSEKDVWKSYFTNTRQNAGPRGGRGLSHEPSERTKENRKRTGGGGRKRKIGRRLPGKKGPPGLVPFDL